MPDAKRECPTSVITFWWSSTFSFPFAWDFIFAFLSSLFEFILDMFVPLFSSVSNEFGDFLGIAQFLDLSISLLISQFFPQI